MFLLLNVAILISWWVAVSFQVTSWNGLILLTAEAALVLMLVLSLSEREEWKRVVFLFLIGLLFRTTQILIIQQLPHAADHLPDSSTYHLHASALVQHWRGHPVPVVDYGLDGLVPRKLDKWLPSANLEYGSVFGTRHFLYELYMGIVYWFVGTEPVNVITSHAVLLAALGPIVYTLARTLFPEKQRVALFAVGLVFIDFNFSAVGAFLLKDALAAVLVSLTVLAVCLVFRSSRWYPAFVLLAVLTGLSLVRYHVVVAFWAVVLPIALWTWRSLGSRKLVAVVVLSFLASSLVYTPSVLQRGFSDLIASNLQTVSGGLQTLVNSAGPAPTDPVPETPAPASPVLTSSAPTRSGPTTSYQPPANPVRPPRPEAFDVWTHQWLQALQKDPVLALVKSGAHTLFAPYPWTPLFHGFSYNFSELLYPGVIMWILALPLIALALRHLPFQSPQVLVVALWATLIVGAYVVFQGEFSGRQRIFLMPLFWLLAGYGLDVALVARVARRPVRTPAST